MSLYQILRVANGTELLDVLPKGDITLSNSKLHNFTIKTENHHIKGIASDFVRSIRSTDDNELLDEININLIIKKYRMQYCVVGLSGRGLMTIHAYPKYIREVVVNPLKTFLNERYGTQIDFETVSYSNDHFSRDYWGENIRSKLAYNSSEKMYLRISSPKCNEIIESNPLLSNYFSYGIIKYVIANVSDLGYLNNEVRQIGNVKFQRDGIFRCLFFDVQFFNDFVEKMIDRGFFGEVK